MLKEMFKKTKYIPLGSQSNSNAKKIENENNSIDSKNIEMANEKKIRNENKNEPSIPSGAWKKCDKCNSILYFADIENNTECCPKCNYHFKITSKKRIEIILDYNSFEEWDQELNTTNILKFPEYDRKIDRLKEATGLQEAVLTGKGKIKGNTVAIAIMDNSFLMGSMGQIVGEKITKAIEKATEERLPIIIFCTSGGARMQEGIVSLMQMAKTSAALKKHSKEGLLYLSVLTNPTTGGVTASFAMLGDIILAEPGALIGFAGPRVIEQTIKQKLPEKFQTSEFLLEKGFVDKIVERKNLRDVIASILKMHIKEKQDNCKKFSIKEIKQSSERNCAQEKTAWNRVLIARKLGRPTTLDYINLLFDDFIEFHGDRCYGEDRAVVGGIALYKGVPITVIGQQKGKNTKDNIRRNFGMPNPEGYRKALRLMKEAEKFNRPILCFVDTPGAFCGIGAEERGQGQAIANNLFEMSDIGVPILSIVIGEGGSGGALALAVANEVWMLENSIYSVLSPEGFASILWKDSTRAKEAAEVMKITAYDLYQLQIIEKIIKEPSDGIEHNITEVLEQLDHGISEFIVNMSKLTREELVSQRYEKYRKLYN